MVKLGELFGTGSSSAAGRGVVAPPLEPPPVSRQGVPPGDQRYGREAPLTDRYAGKSLAELLQDMAGSVDPQKVLEQIKPTDGGNLLSTMINNQAVYLQPQGGGPPTGAVDPAQLVVVPTAEAKQLMEGGKGQTLLGQAGAIQQPRPPAMPGVNTGGPPLGPPGPGGFRV